MSSCCVISDTFFLCCPRKSVNFNKPGPLICCNLPWDAGLALSGAHGWYTDPWSTDRTVTVIPSSDTKLLPAFLLMLPCFWINACMLLCLTEQRFDAHTIEPSPDGQSLMLYKRSLWVCCDDGHEFGGSSSKGVVSGASLQHTKAHSIFSTDTFELSITVSSPEIGLVNLIVDKVASSKSEVKQSLEYLVLTINQRVAEVWARRTDPAPALSSQLAPGQPLPNWQPDAGFGNQGEPVIAVAVPVEGGYAYHPNFSGATVIIEPSAPPKS